MILSPGAILSTPRASNLETFAPYPAGIRLHNANIIVDDLYGPATSTLDGKVPGLVCVKTTIVNNFSEIILVWMFWIMPPSNNICSVSSTKIPFLKPGNWLLN